MATGRQPPRYAAVGLMLVRQINPQTCSPTKLTAGADIGESQPGKTGTLNS